MMHTDKSARHSAMDKPAGEDSASAHSAAPISPLAYEAPADRLARHPQTHPIERVIMFIFGACSGCGFTAVTGAFIYYLMDQNNFHRTSCRIGGAGYMVAAIYFLVLSIGLLRRTKSWTEWKCCILGLLVSSALALAVEGVSLFSRGNLP